jgi:hypothetical protein
MMYQHDSSIRVYAYGQQRPLAWCGGFNNPKFAMGDLNNDGLPDLVAFENFNSLRTFINMGTAGNPDYRYAPEYELNFPPIYDYIVLADYNCDGIPDLFQQGLYGFEVYKGYYNSANQLCFTFYKYLFYANDPSTGVVNAFNNPGDIPAIVDVDNDGDLDFVSYNIIGGAMNYYRNMRVEEGLPCDSIVIHLEDECWGKVYQGFYRTHYLNQPCSDAGLILPRVAGGRPEKVTHSGNTPCLFDYDGDGDYDYLDGSISYNQMTFLENGRIPNNPTGADSMIYQDTTWQSAAGGTSINLSIWPAAFNLDIDQDGKKDLLIAPNGGTGSENYNCIWFYKNQTTPGSPDWVFKSDSFLVDKSIDLGTGSYPVLYDYNHDGKPDLFIGSDGYFQSSTGQLKARISYYMNTSTPGSPSFTLQTTDFMGLSSYGFEGAAPAFGDIDNDGKDDLIIGHSNGTLSYFKNTAASDTSDPVWTLQELQLTASGSAVINTGGYAAPLIYDIDKDGKKDLLTGNFDGYLEYYENTSTTAGVKSLTLANTRLGGIQADPDQFIGNYSVPFIGKVDASGTEYLMMGSNSGNIYQFTGFQSGDTSATYTMMSGQYDYIDSTYLTYSNAGTADAVYGDLRSSVTVGDVAGDSSYYMIVGNLKGGVELYKLKRYFPMGVSNVPENGKVLVYPNPAKDVLNINWSGILQTDVQISILNMEGRTMSTSVAGASARHAAIPLTALPSGLYVCMLQSGVNRYYSKFTVVR